MQMLGNLEQNETYILYFLPPPSSKNVSAPLQPVSKAYFQVSAFPDRYFSFLWVLFRLMQIRKLQQHFSFLETIVL